MSTASAQAIRPREASSLSADRRREIDGALADLARTRDRWARLPAAEKAVLLDRVLADLHPLADEWTEICARAKRVDPESAAGAEERLTFYFLLRAVTSLRQAVRDIARHGRPLFRGPMRRVGADQLAVRVMPRKLLDADRLFFPGTTAEVWMQPGADERTLREEQAAAYRGHVERGRIVMVLGAGNVSLLGPIDVLEKMFCEGEVVIYKTHPVVEYLTPLVERGFRALIDGGYLRVVSGGVEEGHYLANHDLVDALHLTGSDRTYDAIVFGTGEEGRRRKQAGERLLTKEFTCELGCVSPVIIVPGPWSESDIAWQGEHLAAMQVLNAGFNCLNARLLIQHAGWHQRGALLAALRNALERVPNRYAYYPGAHQIHRDFVAAHPEATQVGATTDATLPWTVIEGVPSDNARDIAFTREAFCSLMSETTIAGDDVPAFLENAVRFANEKVWGTLAASIIVHPKSLEDPRVARAVENAIRDLRYGTVAVNLWATLNFVSMVGTWGAYPGHPYTDIQSGHGVVHNHLMIPRVQKTVMRGPFRRWPKPIEFPSHRTRAQLARRLVDFEVNPSVLKLPGIFVAAMRG